WNGDFSYSKFSITPYCEVNDVFSELQSSVTQYASSKLSVGRKLPALVLYKKVIGPTNVRPLIPDLRSINLSKSDTGPKAGDTVKSLVKTRFNVFSLTKL